MITFSWLFANEGVEAAAFEQAAGDVVGQRAAKATDLLARGRDAAADGTVRGRG